jgi:hypothetical protein
MKRVLLFALLLALHATRAGAGDVNARIQDLIEGRTVPFHSVYEIVNIKVGSKSVWPLLKITESNGTWKWASLVKTVVVQAANPKAFAELRALLMTQDSPALTIELEGSGVRQWMNDRFGDLVRREWPRHATITLRVSLDENPCEPVKRVIYRSIDPALKTLISSGQTKQPITLDSLFRLLIADHLQPYMDKELQPIDLNHRCFENFLLYNWIKGEQASGFEYEKYELNPDLHEILSRIADALAMHRKSQRFLYEIDVTGYTDLDKFIDQPQLPLQASQTGIEELHDPLLVFYAGCAGNSMTGPNPTFVEGGVASGTPVGPSVENNCELGAVRAYVTLAALANRLGSENATYRYASGGMAKDQSSAAEQRKVAISIRVKTGDQQ